MKKIGIGVDYSNICKEYNTVYLDRDNTDPATAKCMKRVLTWTKGFITDILEAFGYQIHNLNSSVSVGIDDIASKRFLFYSLEKEITLQSYVIQEAFVQYDGLSSWELEEKGTILVQNDVDGGGIYFFVNENSQEYLWIVEKLKSFSLDEVPFEAK
jgi:hypothetical protein